MTDTACASCGGPLHPRGWGGRFCLECCRSLDAADPVSAMGLLQPFSATYRGETYRFYAAEHFNLGPGWMCTEMDKKLSEGVIASNELSDVRRLEIDGTMPEYLRVMCRARQAKAPTG